MKRIVQTCNSISFNRCLALICALILFFTGVFYAMADIKDNETTLSTPYESVFQHIENIDDNHNNPEIAAKALNVINPYTNKSKELAIKLAKIFDGKGLIVDLNSIPKNPDYIDSISKKNKYVLFEELPEVYLEKVGNKWLYSKETVNSIPDLYEKIYPLEIDKLMSQAPKFFRSKFIGMEIWKYLGIIVYSLIGFIFYILISKLFFVVLCKLLSKYGNKQFAVEYLKPVAKPLGLLCVFIIIYYALPLLQLPLTLFVIFHYSFKVLIPITATYIAFKLSDMVADIIGHISVGKKSASLENLAPIIRKLLKIIVITGGILLLLESLSVSITPLLAGVSIGGLAIALAAQDTVKNLFGSFTIFTDKPFEVGDWIVFDSTEGIVVEVGMRSTRIRTFYDSLISIPNGKLADMKIDNMGKREYRRYQDKIFVTYDTPTSKLEAFIDKIKIIILEHPDTRKENIQVSINEFTENAVQILINIFFQVEDYQQEMLARQFIILEIKKAADEIGIRFAYPLRDYSVTLPEANIQVELKK